MNREQIPAAELAPRRRRKPSMARKIAGAFAITAALGAPTVKAEAFDLGKVLGKGSKITEAAERTALAREQRRHELRVADLDRQRKEQEEARRTGLAFIRRIFTQQKLKSEGIETQGASFKFAKDENGIIRVQVDPSREFDISDEVIEGIDAQERDFAYEIRIQELDREKELADARVTYTGAELQKKEAEIRNRFGKIIEEIRRDERSVQKRKGRLERRDQDLDRAGRDIFYTSSDETAAAWNEQVNTAIAGIVELSKREDARHRATNEHIRSGGSVLKNLL